MAKKSKYRDMKFDFKLSESEYIKLKKTAFLLNITMSDLIRDALSMKYSELLKQEIGRKSNA